MEERLYGVDAGLRVCGIARSQSLSLGCDWMNVLLEDPLAWLKYPLDFLTS